MRHLRLEGGVRALLRFSAVADPAVSRLRGLGDAAVNSGHEVNGGHAAGGGQEVVDISPAGETVPMFDITTGTGDFVAEGVVSHNCFARNTHTYLDLDAGADFDRQIVVKVNVAGCRARTAVPALAARTRGDGHQHRPLPAGGGPLPAHAGIVGARSAPARRSPSHQGHGARAGPAAAGGVGRRTFRVGARGVDRRSWPEAPGTGSNRARRHRRPRCNLVRTDHRRRSCRAG